MIEVKLILSKKFTVLNLYMWKNARSKFPLYSKNGAKKPKWSKKRIKNRNQQNRRKIIAKIILLPYTYKDIVKKRKSQYTIPQAYQCKIP